MFGSARASPVRSPNRYFQRLHCYSCAELPLATRGSGLLPPGLGPIPSIDHSRTAMEKMRLRSNDIESSLISSGRESNRSYLRTQTREPEALRIFAEP